MINQYGGVRVDVDTEYGAGFRSGFLDASLGVYSVFATNTMCGFYSSGYADGQREYGRNRGVILNVENSLVDCREKVRMLLNYGATVNRLGKLYAILYKEYKNTDHNLFYKSTCKRILEETKKEIKTNLSRIKNILSILK